MNRTTFLDVLSSAITSPSVALHNFLLGLNIHKKAIHAFFEGKTDESFYGTFIRKAMDNDYEYQSYICGNKDGVYYQFDRLNGKKVGNNLLLYFADKDIEDIIPFPRIIDTKIYVTDYYSIENYIVNKKILEQVWAEIFRQRSGTAAARLIMDKFELCLSEYHRLMLVVMSWALYHRRNIEVKEESKPNLDCLKLKHIYKINDELEFKLLIGDEEIIRILDKQTKTTTSLAIWAKHKVKLIEELKGHPVKNVVRGHNEIEFFIYFINITKETLHKALGKAVKASVELTDVNAIDVLAPRVQIPLSLDQYLSMHIQPQLTLNINN